MTALLAGRPIRCRECNHRYFSAREFGVLRWHRVTPGDNGAFATFAPQPDHR